MTVVADFWKVFKTVNKTKSSKFLEKTKYLSKHRNVGDIIILAA